MQCEETATRTRDLLVTGGKTLPLAPGPPFKKGEYPVQRVLVAEFSLFVVAEFLLSSREDDTRSWDNFLVYFSMSCQPEGLGRYIFIGS